VTPWPRERFATDDVAIVTVNYNTVDLISLLIYSIHCVLRPASVATVLIVDNASTDGSPDLLAAVEEAGLCSVISNADNRNHGPAINQAIDRLAVLAATDRSPRWIWILDSDCVIARADALHAALLAANHARATVVGEFQPDPWHKMARFGIHSLLIDPSVTWRVNGAQFSDGGDPAFEFLQTTNASHLAMAEFPFLQGGYVIHRGRGTLDRVAGAGDSSNPLYDWAVDHRKAHFGNVAGAAQRYAALQDEFAAAAPGRSAAELITACLRHRRHRPPVP